MCFFVAACTLAKMEIDYPDRKSHDLEQEAIKQALTHLGNKMLDEARARPPKEVISLNN